MHGLEQHSTIAPCRPSPNGDARAWSLIVRVRDGEGAEWEEVDTLCNTCFQQRNNWTPWLEALEPYAGEPCKYHIQLTNLLENHWIREAMNQKTTEPQRTIMNFTLFPPTASLITISGRIFTIAFDDTPEDPPLDVITRVTVGNRLCNHVNEDGNLWAKLTLFTAYLSAF